MAVPTSTAAMEVFQLKIQQRTAHPGFKILIDSKVHLLGFRHTMHFRAKYSNKKII
jgi:hypothetical protein